MRRFNYLFWWANRINDFLLHRTKKVVQIELIVSHIGWMQQCVIFSDQVLIREGNIRTVSYRKANRGLFPMFPRYSLILLPAAISDHQVPTLLRLSAGTHNHLPCQSLAVNV